MPEDGRAFLEANIAQLQAFLADLPETRMIERLGFQSLLEEFQDRLRLLNAPRLRESGDEG